MKPLIISLGHRYRCDDAVGPYILDRLKPILNTEADFLENTGDIAALITLWQGRDNVILLDACYTEQAPTGHIYRLNGLTEQLPADNPVASSHALNITNAIELGKLMNSLPQSLTIYTIVGQDFSFSEQISADVIRAAKQVVARICDELNTKPADLPENTHHA